ncbi:lytic transglycosylase domain-containing protein [Roseococcus sp. DSY-14]|uniref:lytic transglycosylase domain-containing protein n=1 Tax=Roseococcus sp. DSY-14 TaxID=3369650 RepID=UPI00387B1359
MRRLAALALAALLLPAPARAGDETLCEAAIAAEEAEGRLPPGLLGAIGAVESGRWSPGLRRVTPWPWALNLEGAGMLAPSREAAEAVLRAALAAGRRSVDVGCLQVNLRHHPHAFPRPEDGLDPRLNVAYAARFLLSLKERHGGWMAAAAHYHSATPERGAAYAQRVARAWGQGGGPPVALAAAPMAPPALPRAVGVVVVTPAALPAAGPRMTVLAMGRGRP